MWAPSVSQQDRLDRDWQVLRENLGIQGHSWEANACSEDKHSFVRLLDPEFTFSSAPPAPPKTKTSKGVSSAARCPHPPPVRDAPG